jgi:hypothetical protein
VENGKYKGILTGDIIISINKLDLNLRKKLVKCYTWSIALYGAE